MKNITKYDIAKKRKQVAKRVGAVLTGLTIISPLPMIGCKHHVDDNNEVVNPVITRQFDVLDKKITVEGNQNLFTSDVVNKLTQAFAEYGSYSTPGKNKIRSAIDAGAKIVIKDNLESYTELEELTIFLSYEAIKEEPSNVIETLIFNELTNIADSQVASLGNQYDDSRNTLRFALGKSFASRQLS